MSKLQIPESWASLTFEAAKEIGLVLDIQDGNHGEIHPKASDYKVSGIPFVMANNIYNGRLNLDEVKFISKKQAESLRIGFSKSGDVLLTHKGTIGQSAVVENIESEYVMLTPQVTYYRLNESGLIPKFISFYFQNPLYQAGLKSLSKQATRDYVGITKQATFSFPLPPLGEQKRIVEKIESTQEKVKTIESSISKAEELIEKYRESLLQKAFRGELVPQDPSDEPASKLIERIRTEKAKQSDGKKKKKDELPPLRPEEIPFEIPKSWEWVSLKFILEKLTDGTHHSPPNHDKGDFKYISAKNIKDWGMDLTKITYVSKSVHKEIYSRCDPKFGDVLLIKDGATTGVVTINTLNEPFSMLSSVALLRPSIGITSDYLLWFLKSNEFQSQILGDMAGAAIKRVTLSKLENMLLPLPPVKEQQRIISEINFKVTRLQECRNVLKGLTEYTKSLNQAILSSAFSGNLVPQIPSEGTGHELLEKNKSEQSPIVETKAAKRTSAPAKKKRAAK